MDASRRQHAHLSHRTNSSQSESRNLSSHSSNLTHPSPSRLPQMVLIHPVINHATQSLDISVPSSISSDSASSQTFSISLAHPSTYLKDPENDPSLDHDFVVWGSDPQDGYSVGSEEMLDALSEFMGKRVLLIRKGL